MGWQEEMDLLKRKRAIAKGKFTRKVTLLDEGVRKGEPVSVLKSNYQQISEAFQLLEESNDVILTYVCDNKLDETFVKDAEEYMLDCERIMKVRLTEISKLESAQNSVKPKVKIKAFEPPKFDGNLRDYPRFKEDFKNLVKSVYGEDAYALKMCLSGDALQTVRGAEGNYEEMFERLDDKFGNARKVVDLVISDLKALKRINEGDTKGFIRMVDQVEQCWLDLKKINLNEELNTAHVVSHIERVLPTLQKREWVIKAEEVSATSDLFPTLLKFLQRERKVLEYMNSSIRSTGSDKISVHHVNNSADNNMNSDMITLIKQMKEEQQLKNKDLESCIVNLTEMVKGTHLKTESNDGGCWIHNSRNHDTFDCYKFKNLSNKERFDLARNNGICFRCLNGYHQAWNCNTNKLCDVKMKGQSVCNRHHHPLVHLEQEEGASHNTVSVNTLNTLLNISTVYSDTQPITVLWDSGSDITLVTHSMAEKLRLKGKNVNLSMIKVGNVIEHHSTKEYCIPLFDKTGHIWEINALGIEEISAKINKFDVSIVKELFEGISNHDIDRPCGEIDMLIGVNYSELLPKVVQTNEGLQLLENPFGFSIRGKHSKITTLGNRTNHVIVRTHKVSSSINLNEIKVEHIDKLKSQLDKFFALEESGVQCDTRCIKCLCKGCPVSDCVNIKEERELNLIEKGLVYDEEGKYWTASYPWIRNPRHLKNNVKVAVARLITTENRLRKLDTQYAQRYHNEIKDMVKRGVARQLSKEEMQSYNGPVHYISHHEVLKPDSASTPLRIVFNSSSSYMGQKLNDFWAKGPVVLNNMLGVLLRFRQERVAITGDISKMYHSVKINTLDQHTHRFLWRDLNSNRPPDHYVLTSVTFGDRPSGTIAVLALRHTIEKFGKGDPEVYDMIVNNTYVDDVLYSTDTVEKAIDLIQRAEHVISLGNFHMKHWIVSGQHENHSINIMESDNEKVLGLKWNPKDDKFSFNVRVNFSPKVKKIRSGPDWDRRDIEFNFPEFLTRRMILSQVASFYDPLGLAVPVVLRAKILMRSMISKCDPNKGVEWDEPLDAEIINEWKSFFTDLYGVENCTFKRPLKPTNALGKPILVIFSDGSTQAYGACAYVRWQTDDNKFQANLIMAKNKIAPMRQLTIPRLELCGALLSARLRETIVRECNWEYESVFHIVDSSIVRDQIQKESHGFHPFVAVRIAEIQLKTNLKDWWWVDTSQNVADLTSRPCSSEKIEEGSIWQQGPQFLKLPVAEWPIKQQCADHLPDKIGITMTVAKGNPRNLSMIKVKRFSRYETLLRVTCRIMSIFKHKSLKAVLKEPTSEEMEEAEVMWVKNMQINMTDWKDRYKRLGPMMMDNGVISVGQRISKWLKENWNQDHFMLIPANHPVTRLYVSSLHNRDHAGIETTLAKLQSKFWVPGARKIIKSVKDKCVTCRKLLKQTENQCMGQMLEERMKPTPPFYHTAVDLFGPLTIKDTVKKRTHGKVYGVIFNCLVTRAVYLDLAEGYSANAFLATYQRFISVRGAPKILYSDRGSQLIAAGKNIERIGNNEGVIWKYNRPSDAPWYNGASESLIKSVKRNLCIAIGDSVLTFGELQTALFNVASMMNERPIGVKPCFNLELGNYLCPNDLLLGRATVNCPQGTYGSDGDHKRRLEFIQKIVESFWKKWQRDFFPTLIVRQKWHTNRRNVRVGDVVLVQDANALRGTWKLAQVIEANPGRDGVVRDVDLRYKIVKEGKGYDGVTDKVMSKSVHRLIVLLPKEEQE